MKITSIIDIGDKVNIIDAEKIAVVDAILMSVKGMEYRVVFWDDTERKTEWVYPNEICTIKKESRIIK